MTDTLPMDQLFINRLTRIILDNISDPDFDVMRLADAMSMSYSALYRRLKESRNQDVSHFISEVRLKKAMELLLQEEGTVAEIAYKVGFGSPTYFNRCFHDYYGYTPGEVKKRRIIRPEYSGIPVSIPATDSEEVSQTADKETAPPFRPKQIKHLIAVASALLLVLLSWHLYVRYIRVPVIPPGADSFNRSIVIIPFKDLSGDPDNQYFADGIMEDILNSLFRITELRVVSRTTSEMFRNSNLSVPQIAQMVNVNYVLIGSVRRYGNKSRITVQLIDAMSDEHLWSENFDREVSDIMSIQGDVALQVAHMLNVFLSDSEKNSFGSISTRDPVAYDYYLRGRFLLHKANGEHRSDFDRNSVMNCLQYYERAIEADPDFADAYAGLANAWFNLSAWGFLQSDEGFSKAKELSLRAISIDSGCAEAHAVLGAQYVWPARDFEAGRKALLTSIQLNPNFSTARQWYTQLLQITGPIEEARVQINRSLELEPFFWLVHTLSAWIYYFEEKYEKAIEACHYAHDLNPDYSDINWLLVLNYAKLGEGEKAARALQKIANRYPAAGEYSEEIMDAYRMAGINGLFSWLIDVNRNRPVPVEGMTGHPFFIAWWNVILGNSDEAIYWLEKNMESKRRLYVYFNLIATNPDFDILRDDPRFLAIIDQIGLTPYHRRPPG